VYSRSLDEYRESIEKPLIMTNAPHNSPKPILRISLSDENRLGRGKMELMEHIRDTGSISAAGRAMDMSYRRAWMLISELNHMFREPVVESQRGGQKGGGAALTAFGEELLDRFRHMEKSVREAIADDLDWLEANRNLAAPSEEAKRDA
jgi:molybdate transport system regulatory protein